MRSSSGWMKATPTRSHSCTRRRTTGQQGGLGGPDDQEVSEALTALKTRIAADRAEQPDREVLVFVYDSGHASSPKLHLRGSHLPFKALTAQVK